MSNVFQKTGFFPGAHGIPDVSRLEDDGDSRNIELPYSKVNHLKVTTHQQYVWEKFILSGDMGYQNNHREEWSAFHTHYGSQPLPQTNPDKELGFNLNTFSFSAKGRLIGSSSGNIGWDGILSFRETQFQAILFCCRNMSVSLPGYPGLQRIVRTMYLLLVEVYGMIMGVYVFLPTMIHIWQLICKSRAIVMNRWNPTVGTVVV